jgi:hypothetical protein
MPFQQRLVGLLCLVLAFVLAGGAVVYAVRNWQPAVVVDDDNCPSTPPGAWLAAFDQTDKWPPQEQERITSSVLVNAERMAKHERLALHVLTGEAEDAARPVPLPDFRNGFRLCKPADPNTVDPTVGNESLERATYEQKFLAPLKRALPALVTGATADRSPLLQAIEIMLWSPHFRADIPRRTLVLYSDFLLHTNEVSQLSGPLADPCTVLASPIGKRLAARQWRGVTVSLEYLRNPRDQTRQTAEHLRFWVHLFYHLAAGHVIAGPTPVANDTSACAPKIAARLARRLNVPAAAPPKRKRR